MVCISQYQSWMLEVGQYPLETETKKYLLESIYLFISWIYSSSGRHGPAGRRALWLRCWAAHRGFEWCQRGGDDRTPLGRTACSYSVSFTLIKDSASKWSWTAGGKFLNGVHTVTMRTLTMSRASAAATRRTGQSHLVGQIPHCCSKHTQKSHLFPIKKIFLKILHNRFSSRHNKATSISSLLCNSF